MFFGLQACYKVRSLSGASAATGTRESRWDIQQQQELSHLSQLVGHVAIVANLVFKHEHSMLIPHTAARANRDVSDAARAVTKRHVWYLKPPLAVLSLFSDRAPVDQKSGMSKKRWGPRAARNRKVLNECEQ